MASHPFLPANFDSIRLGWALIHFLWQGIVIALLLEMALMIAGRRNASLRYVLCALALAAMPVCLVDTYLYLGRDAAVTLSPAADATAMPLDPLLHRAAAPHFALLPVMHTITDFTSLEISTFDLNRWLPGIVTGWLAGIVFLTLRKAGGLMVLSRWRRHEVYVPNEAMCELCRQACAKIGVDPRRIYLGISNLIEVPMTMGWLRPVILFPATLLTGLSVEEIELLLAHELAHIRRCDYLVNLIQIAIENVFFYHPATWWISRRMRQERENSCDDLVALRTGGLATYARALFHLETLRLSNDTILAPAATGGSLVQRIERLASEPGRKTESGILSRLAFFVTVVALITICLNREHSEFSLKTPSSRNPDSQWTSDNSLFASGGLASREETIYQDNFNRTGELDGSSPGMVNKTGATWKSSTGENQYRTSGHAVEISPSAYAYSLAYLPVNGTSGITLDGKKDFVLSVVVNPGSTGRTGISLNTGPLEHYSNLYTHSLATLATGNAFAGAYNFNSDGLNIQYCFDAGTHGPTRISLSYRASAGTLTYKVGVRVLHVQNDVRPEQVAAIRYIGLGNDGFNSGIPTPPGSAISAPTFHNFAFTVRGPDDASSALASIQ